MRNFSDLVDLSVAKGLEHLRPVVEKEILHYDILFALDRSNLMEGLVFQGGTSLRLCYGSHRFSEDLDFVGGFAFASADLALVRECIMDHIARRYGLEIDVKNPKQMRQEPNYLGLEVDRWQVSVTTNPGRSDLPRQKIKLEIANVPAHTKTLRPLDRNYEHLPTSYEDLLVPVETMDEIMADKIVSLAACSSHIRYRDVWDLHWMQRKGATFSPEIVERKISDYKSVNFEDALNDMTHAVRAIATSPEFKAEMGRFLSPRARSQSIDKEGYCDFLGENVSGVLGAAQEALYDLSKEIDEDEFSTDLGF